MSDFDFDNKAAKTKTNYDPYIIIVNSRALAKEKTLYEITYRSLLNQTVKPRAIFVIIHYRDSPIVDLSGLTYLKGPKSLPYDKVSFMPCIPLMNIGIAQARENENIVICGDDSYFPPNYFEHLLADMKNDPTIGMISGLKRERNIIETEHKTLPTGSGRMHSFKITKKIFPIPLVNYDETLRLFQCEMLGFKATVCTKTYFDHLRPSTVSLKASGQAAYELGYPFIQSLARFSLWIITEHKFKTSFLLGHIQAMLCRYPKADPDVLRFVRAKLPEKYRQILSISMPLKRAGRK